MSTTVPNPSSPPEVLASDLCWLMYRATRNQQAESEAAILETGLTLRKHQVLATAVDGEHTQTELAKLIGLDKTTMMVTVDELERDGLAERRQLPSDRRARVVTLTKSGHARCAAAQADIRAMEDEFLANLTPVERDRLRRTLAGLALTTKKRPRSGTRPRAPLMPRLHSGDKRASRT